MSIVQEAPSYALDLFCHFPKRNGGGVYSPATVYRMVKPSFSQALIQPLNF